MDMNDRQLRQITDGLGGRTERRTPGGRFRHHRRQQRSWLSSACPADLTDLKERLASIVVGYTREEQPVTAGRAESRRGHGRPAQGRHQAQSGPDAGAHPRLCPRRALRQHRPRLQQRHRHPHGPEAGGLRRHRGGLRRRSGRGKIPGYQMPQSRPEARCGGDRRHRPRPQASRRRRQIRTGHGESGGSGEGSAQPV